MEVGDVFIIIGPSKITLKDEILRNDMPLRYRKEGRRSHQNECRDPNKKFIIESFSKSGLSVYYKDERTNIKCLCSYCKPYRTEYYDKPNWYVPTPGELQSIDKKLRCIGKTEIRVVETRLERIRDIKLKLLI